MRRYSSGLAGGTLCRGTTPACGSITVFMLMQVTHDSMKSTKSRANTAAVTIAKQRKGKTPSLLPRFPKQFLHTHSPRPTMTNLHSSCVALVSAVAAAAPRFSTNLLSLVSTVTDGHLPRSNASPHIRSALHAVEAGGMRRSERIRESGWNPCEILQPSQFDKSGICSCANKTVDSAAALSLFCPDLLCGAMQDALRRSQTSQRTSMRCSSRFGP